MPDVAKGTAPRALVAHDHESGRAFAKAFADVGARGLFADRHQFVGAQDVLDFVQARFAEVLAREQLLLGRASQVAERHDAHLLQAVAAPDGEFEIGHRQRHDLLEAVALLLLHAAVQRLRAVAVGFQRVGEFVHFEARATEDDRALRVLEFEHAGEGRVLQVVGERVMSVPAALV